MKCKCIKDCVGNFSVINWSFRVDVIYDYELKNNKYWEFFTTDAILNDSGYYLCDDNGGSFSFNIERFEEYFICISEHRNDIIGELLNEM